MTALHAGRLFGTDGRSTWAEPELPFGEPVNRYACTRCGAESPCGIGYYAGDDVLPDPDPECPGPHA
ncbi:MAG TPA: hypothetical protein VF288_10760 [Mycobacteriales bacterium]